VWAGIIAFAVAVVVMDGFDSRHRILLPGFAVGRDATCRDERDRAGVGRQRNLAGARRRRALMAAFPLALADRAARSSHAAIAICVGLVFRGGRRVRWRDPAHIWDGGEPRLFGGIVLAHFRAGASRSAVLQAAISRGAAMPAGVGLAELRQLLTGSPA